MSRFKRFARSLLSGYLQSGAQSVFKLASLPMALHYLPTKAEFALWGVTIQMAAYIALVDFGLSSASARLLIDYKDHQDRAQYGGMVVTGALVGMTQAALVLLLGIGVAFLAGPMLIPGASPDLEQKLFWLMVGESVITAAMFATRIVVHVLTSHQRYDVNNLSSAFSLVVNLGTMWWGFAYGMGVYAMLLGQACGVASSITVDFIWCRRLQLLPRRGEWGRPTWEKFRALFSFASSAVLVTLGFLLINTVQVFLVTRLVGLDAAAVWYGCTSAFLVLLQVIVRIFDFSTAALAEMIVRGERALLQRRFRDLVILTMNLSVAAGAVYAVCNGAFMQVWTSGKLGWPAGNDFLVGAWLVINIAVRVHCGLISQTKEFRFMRFIFFLEAIVFIGLTLLLHRFGGITMMLALSILCSLCFSYSYGLRRTREYFHLSWGDLARWHRGTLALAGTVAPAGVMVWWFTRNLPPLQRLLLESTVFGIWTACMFLRYGLDDSLRAEASRRLPAWARPMLIRAGLAKTEAQD